MVKNLNRNFDIITEDSIYMDGDFLREVSNYIEGDLNEYHKSLMASMEDLLDSKRKIYGMNPLGISAIQIGVKLRIFAFKIKKGIYYIDGESFDDKRSIALYNPQIEYYGVCDKLKVEDCLSVNNREYSNLKIKRYDEVRLTGYTIDGGFFEMFCKGDTARVVQHEYDHLDGILYYETLND